MLKNLEINTHASMRDLAIFVKRCSPRAQDAQRSGDSEDQRASGRQALGSGRGQGDWKEESSAIGIEAQLRLVLEKLDVHGDVLQKIADVVALQAHDIASIKVAGGGSRLHATDVTDATSGSPTRALAEHTFEIDEHTQAGVAALSRGASVLRALALNTSRADRAADTQHQPTLVDVSSSSSSSHCPTALASQLEEAVEDGPSEFGPASASSSPCRIAMQSSVAPAAAFATWSQDGEIQAIHQDNFVAASSPSSAQRSPVPQEEGTTPRNLSRAGSLHSPSKQMLPKASRDLDESSVSGDLGFADGRGFRSLSVVKSPYAHDYDNESLATVSLEVASLDRDIAAKVGRLIPADERGPAESPRAGSSEAVAEWSVIRLLQGDFLKKPPRDAKLQSLNFVTPCDIWDDDAPSKQAEAGMTSKEIAAMLM